MHLRSFKKKTKKHPGTYLETKLFSLSHVGAYATFLKTMNSVSIIACL